MRKSLLPLAIVIIGVAGVFAISFVLRGLDFHSPNHAGTPIGEIQSIKDDVQKRLSGAVDWQTAHGSETFSSGETILTGPQAEALVGFNGGTVIRILSGSRFVAETDATKPQALLGTLLEGELRVTKLGASHAFRLFRNGKEVALSTSDEKATVAIVPDGPVASQNASQSAKPPDQTAAGLDSGLIVSATSAASDELPSSAPATPTPTDMMGTGSESAAVLTNEDIVRSLRGQMGFFQRCYLNYLHREQNPESSPVLAAATPVAASKPKEFVHGKVVLAFRILPSGKATDTRIVQSDFSDRVLHRCVSEVVERTAFQPFNGPAVQIEQFPITLQ